MSYADNDLGYIILCLQQAAHLLFGPLLWLMLLGIAAGAVTGFATKTGSKYIYACLAVVVAAAGFWCLHHLGLPMPPDTRKPVPDIALGLAFVFTFIAMYLTQELWPEHWRFSRDSRKSVPSTKS